MVLAVLVLFVGPIFYARLQGSAERNRRAEAGSMVIALAIVVFAVFLLL